jgi:hypothetical protein
MCNMCSLFACKEKKCVHAWYADVSVQYMTILRMNSEMSTDKSFTKYGLHNDQPPESGAFIKVALQKVL